LERAAFLDEYSTSSRADALSLVVRDVDLPDVYGSTGVNRFCVDGDDSFAHSPEMIRVDLDSHWRKLLKVHARDSADRGCDLSKKQRDASVHDPDVLMNFRRDLHRENDVIGLGLFDLYAEELHQRVFTGLFNKFRSIHSFSLVNSSLSSGQP
jgi:hypothetical protein